MNKKRDNNEIDASKQIDLIDVLRQQLRVTNGHPLLGHQAPTRVAAFSNDGHWLVTASEDGMVQLWALTLEDPARVIPAGLLQPQPLTAR